LVCSFRIAGIIDVGWGENEATEPAPSVNGSVELKAVMPALVVLTEVSSTFGRLVPVGSGQLTDFEHGSVHEADESFSYQQ